MEHIYKNASFGEDWFTYPKLYSSFIDHVKDNSIIVEVGCWKGKSTAYLAVEAINSNKNIKIHAVDTWEGSGNEQYHMNDEYVKTNTLYDLFLRNIDPVDSVIIPIRMESLKAAQLYSDNTIDVVFIDANHEYKYVLDDIEAWLPKVKSGGILAGHDYGWEGVKRAVHEKLGNNIFTQEECWIYHKK
jgi:predicted O-methyltransferase YrrM